MDYYEDSLISKLLESHKHSDVPPNFYRWGALAMTATLAARNNYFMFMNEPEYLNLYVLLTANSGNRKSVALKHCQSLMNQVGYAHFMPNRLNSSSLYTNCQPAAKALRASLTEGVKKPHERLSLISKQIENKARVGDKAKDLRALRLNLAGGDSDGSTLRAGIAAQLSAEALAAEQEGELFTDVTEIALWNHEFINIYDKPNGDLTLFLNDIYDATDYYSVSNNKVIYQPIVNLFSCITPAGLGSAFNGASFLNGMLPRTHVVYGQAVRGVDVNPFKVNRDISDDTHLVAHLNEILKLKGEIRINDEVADKLYTIYQVHRNAEDPRLSGYKDRSLVHLTKIACCLALGRLSLEVSIDDVLYASSIMLYTESGVPNALGDFANTPDARAKSIILRVLENSESPLTMTEVLAAVMNQDSSISEAIAQAALHSLVSIKEVTKLQQRSQDQVANIMFTHKPRDIEAINKFDGTTFKKEYIPEADW